MSVVKDTISFIEKAKKTHGDKYDYSKVQYKSTREKVEIICLTHGAFWQSPYHHIGKRQNCPKCAVEIRGRNQMGDTKIFVSKSLDVHGDKYTYDEVKYINSKTKVKINCPEHGQFLQTPSEHLAGKGCRKCGIKSTNDRNRKSKGDFIRNAINVHGNKYDYSKVVYKSALKPVTIICSKHGEFTQRPNNHLNGQGCSQCGLLLMGYGKSGYYSTDKKSYLYIARINSSFLKVGLSKYVNARLARLAKDTGYFVEEMFKMEGAANELYELENKILRECGHLKFKPEIKFKGYTECLHEESISDILNIIKTYTIELNNRKENVHEY